MERGTATCHKSGNNPHDICYQCDPRHHCKQGEANELALTPPAPGLQVVAKSALGPDSLNAMDSNWASQWMSALRLGVELGLELGVAGGVANTLAHLGPK
jgi:hypothetical protein